jgi:hypothetical protein
MSIFRNDTLGSWTRGGQATVHNVRMTTQVFKQTTLAGAAKCPTHGQGRM